MWDPAALADRLAATVSAAQAAWTQLHVELCEVPAPPFGEAARGLAFADALVERGLREVATDEAGNVVGRYARGGDGPTTVVSAHLDTVFGPDTDCRVRRDGELLQAPGIGDDVSGLVLLVALADSLLQHEVDLGLDLWVVATVGEESAGNLRGARYLAANGAGGRPVNAFVTLDSSVAGQVVRHGTHSHNLELALFGPGGHAWGDHGVVSPSLTLARIIAGASSYTLPALPRTTLNCGLLHSGFAPNAIPDQARGHLNLRSESQHELERLVNHVNHTIDTEVAAADCGRQHGPALRCERQDATRPGGETPADSPLVAAAVAAASRLDQPVSHPYSSTDANAFMALGIDAICLYRGHGGGEHTLEEWYDASSRAEALRQLAETVLRYDVAMAVAP